MVSGLPPTEGTLVSYLSLGIVLTLLAQSLTGTPGVSGPVPTVQLAGNGLVLVLGAYWVARSGTDWPWPRARIVFLWLVAVSLLGCVFTLAPFLSQLAMASLAGALGVFLVMDLGLRNRSHWRLAAASMVAATNLSGLHALFLWQAAGGAEPLKGTFTNPDCYSVIPLLGSLLALGLALERPGRGRVLFTLSFFLQVTCLVLTASRAGLLALAGGYAGFVFTLGSSRSLSWRKAAVQLLLLPSALGLLLLTAGTNLPLVSKWDQLARGRDPVAVKSRWDVLRHGYRTVLRHPWTGSGPGCFALAYQQDRPALAEGEDYMNVAHNDTMQWAVEAGIPGGLLWLALLVVSVRGAWRSYSSPTPWVAAQIGAVLGVAIYGWLNFACPVPADLLWIGALLGLGAGLERLSREPAPATYSPKLFPLGLALGIFGLWTFRFGLACHGTQRLSNLARQAQMSLDFETAITILQPALNRQPKNHQLQLQMAELCQRAYAYSSSPQWLDGQAQALEKAYQANPRDLQIQLSRIALSQEQGDFATAAEMISQAERWVPSSAKVQRAKARNLILTQNIVEATQALADSQKTGQPADDPALADLIFLLEWKAPQTGTRHLSQVYFRQRERAYQLGLSAAHRAQELEETEVAVRFLKHLNTLEPNRQEILYEIAVTRGLAGQTDREIAILDKLRQKDLELDPGLAEKVWRRWAELRIARGELEVASTQLEDYLISHPRQLWARQFLSEIYLKKGQNSEARAALRDGIPYDQDGSLRVELADLCAAQGLKELARGYYREALPLVSERASVEERLRKLGKHSEFEEEEL